MTKSKSEIKLAESNAESEMLYASEILDVLKRMADCPDDTLKKILGPNVYPNSFQQSLCMAAQQRVEKAISYLDGEA